MPVNKFLTWTAWTSLFLLGMVWVYPFAWLISASFKSSIEIFTKGLNLVPDSYSLRNFSRVWFDANFDVYMFNTALIALGTVIIMVIHTSLAGYVIGRYEFVGRKVVIFVLGATFVVPVGVLIIPIVDISTDLGLMGTKTGVIAVLASTGVAASVLLYASFFASIPKEIEEAAILDGSGFFRVYFSIMLPLAGPITATVSVLTFLAAWNNFLVPLVFTFGDPESRTLAVGMLAFIGTNETDWSGMAAAATVSVVPVMVFFIFVQRYFVEGIAGAVK